MPQPHATIIGAGIVGVSTAAFLQRAGYRVTLIDRLPPGEGCSFGNAGGIAFCEIVPPIHPRILLKIPGWLMDPLGPLTIRWSYLPKALPWFLAAGRNAMRCHCHAYFVSAIAAGERVVDGLRPTGSDARGVSLKPHRRERAFRARASVRPLSSS